MPSRREQVRDVLQTLASEDVQLAYEKDVPHVNITAELIEQWFSDLYNGERPGDWPDDAATFSEDELTALAEFHQFYDERVDRLPQSRGTVRTWLANPIWREIMTHAQRTLEQVSA